jgi:hypothetical protein
MRPSPALSLIFARFFVHVSIVPPIVNELAKPIVMRALIPVVEIPYVSWRNFHDSRAQDGNDLTLVDGFE